MAAAQVREAVRIPIGGPALDGTLDVPASASGIVAFVHGSGSSRHSPRNGLVARMLRERGLGTLLFDLLTEEEGLDRSNVFDIELLAGRVAAARAWLAGQPATAGLPVGLFGASTGAAAALVSAAIDPDGIDAVVSRGGRPDLAGTWLAQVEAPTLLVVGGRDEAVLRLNEAAAALLRCEHRLAVVPGATHLFEEPGALEAVAELAGSWFAASWPITAG